MLLEVLSLLLILAAPQPLPIVQASSQTLYGCNSGSFGGSSSFYTLDASTGTATLVNVAMGINGCSGLAFQPSTGVLFAVGRNPSTGEVALFTVNPTVGVGTLVGQNPTLTCNGSTSFISDISFRPSDGALYGYLMQDSFSISGLIPKSTNSISNCLGKINPSNGAVTNLGSTGDCCGANGIAFDSSNTLWHTGDSLSHSSNSGFIDNLNQNTGVAGPHTILTGFYPTSGTCSTGPSPRINGLAFNSAGSLYGTLNCGTAGGGPTYLVTINISTGVVTDVGQTANGMDALAFSPTKPTPPPTPAHFPTRPIPVGGTLLPTNEFTLLLPWIVAIATLTTVAIQTLIVDRRRRRKRETEA